MSIVFATNNGKQFEKPATGMYHGVLADIVDLGPITTVYQGSSKTQPMVRFVWILNQNGTDGAPLRVTQRLTTNLHEKSNLYKTVKQILNAAPPVTFDGEQIVGQVRKLFIQRDIDEAAKKDFANILGISPADPGVVVAVPQGFVRDKNLPLAEQAKNKPKKNFNQPATQPIAAAAQPAQAAPVQQGVDVRF